MSALAATSLAAFHSIDLTDLEEQVRDVIASFGAHGCISDEVRDLFPTLSYSSVTARFASLEEKGAICRNGDTRKGDSGRQQQVMRDGAYAIVKPPVLVKPKNPFLAGMMFAAKFIVSADPTFKGTPAAMALKSEILKVARR